MIYAKKREPRLPTEDRRRLEIGRIEKYPRTIRETLLAKIEKHEPGFITALTDKEASLRQISLENPGKVVRYIHNYFSCKNGEALHFAACLDQNTGQVLKFGIRTKDLTLDPVPTEHLKEALRYFRDINRSSHP